MALVVKDGSLVVVGGSLGTNQNCCCAGCVDCQFCMTGKFLFRGQTREPPFLDEPNPEPECRYVVVCGGEIINCTNDACGNVFADENGHIQNLPDGGQGLPWCVNDDESWPQEYIFWKSQGGRPWASIACENGVYKLRLCRFSTCGAPSSDAGGRLTRKTYAIELDANGCPQSVGSLLSEDTTDFYAIGGLWTVLPAGIDLDGSPQGSNIKWCNQYCWDDWPYDFEIVETGCSALDGVACNPLP